MPAVSKLCSMTFFLFLPNFGRKTVPKFLNEQKKRSKKLDELDDS